MKKIVIYLMYLFVVTAVLAQSTAPRQEPLNPEFIRYAKIHSREAVEKSASRYNSLGYMPHTVAYKAEVPDDYTEEEMLPSVYDLRSYNLITSVKNQGNCGTCWSFASLGSIESRWLKLGFGTWDLSENNVVYGHGFEYAPDDGGNAAMTTAYLIRGDGPIFETDDPYQGCAGSYHAGLTPVAYIPDMRVLPEERNVIKQHVYDYGALYVCYYQDTSYYDSETYTYFYNGPDTTATNHCVLLAGWDDTKETAGGVGAWIVKNSWSSFFGDNGYFYISYYDSTGVSDPTVWPNRIDYNDKVSICYYDTLGNTAGWGYGWGKQDYVDYGLIHFTVPQNSTITKLGTWVKASGGSVDFSVFDTFNGSALSGLLGTISEQTCNYPGYYTFDLPEPIQLKNGGDIYIKTRYYAPGDSYPIPTESYTAFGDLVYADPGFKLGECWISDTGNSGTWYESNSSREFDLCIKAYVISDQTGIDQESHPSVVPKKCKLLQNYPNPFNPLTSIQFTVKEAGPVSLKVYSLLGKELTTLVNSYYQPGHYQVSFNASGMATGVYMYRITMKNFSAVKKMVVMD
ncbi:MAG: C1 family peptidase [bacterium]